MSRPGPNPSRQSASHPHEALTDPTGSYVIIPDLGADLVRIFSINHRTSNLTALTPFRAPPGSGPRHGAFLKSKDSGETFFFLLSELGNAVTSYKVTYGAAGPSFEEVFSSGVYGDRTTPEGAAAAEAILTVCLSSRNPSIPSEDMKASQK